jgi:hypothetical protein
MEAPVSKSVLTRAISQAVNEMHGASFISTMKVLEPPAPSSVITLEILKKAYRGES